MKQSNAGTVIVIETCEFLNQGVKWILVLDRTPRENNHNNCMLQTLQKHMTNSEKHKSSMIGQK